MKSTRTTVGLVVWLLVSFIPALVGALFPPNNWYEGLKKPDWNPPSWLFGPVWTFLYFTMGVAAWLVWKRGGWKNNSEPLGFFLAQLLLNGIWSPLFFGLHLPDASFAVIILLWIGIGLTIHRFRSVSGLAALLLIPYWGWVSFAAALNYSLWQLNR